MPGSVRKQQCPWCGEFVPSEEMVKCLQCGECVCSTCKLIWDSDICPRCRDSKVFYDTHSRTAGDVPPSEGAVR
ncbi:hypothetical protein LCGC14_1698210 [marine sediment metagenome]|uniref:RING-type domain-containing protein n=1 Tax=marine sediment metagenome TaxID=412755 RepID=A0A0F9HJA4_9ZZZZ